MSRSEIEKAAEMEKSKAVRTLNSLIEKKILMSAPMNSLRHLMMKMKLLELVKGPDKSPYLLGSITGINTIDLTGLILKLSDDTKTCEATMDECLSDWMADSIGNLYTGSLLDSNFKQITDNDYDVYLGPGEYYALIDYSEGVDVKVPISIRVPDETPVLTKTGPGRYEATCELLRNL